MSDMTIRPPGGDDDDGIEAIDLDAALRERYLAYALSTITQRALPDVRDGLKPVHRRLLYAMRQLKLDPAQGFKKSARVVGDVIGKYHPHGDQSVYDALVRLAQDFAVRYPLVEGQGNFGNIDGDSAAAMRYTEARMTDVATRLLDGIDEDAVDFRETYDGSEEEPVVLPSDFPNLLANGSTGIAVGMATSIPPHNVAELCDASLALIDNQNMETPELVKLVLGPDFPTGGILVDDEASRIQAYETGRGGFRVRARWHKEDQGRGTWSIVITEIPYQVVKSRLVERIADLLLSKKLPLLGDVRDESAEDMRLVLEPKNRNVDPELMMESLFRLTELESRISLNMNVLDGGLTPRVMGLREVLVAWLDHRRDVLVRRSNYRLGKIAARLELLEGFIVAYLNLDEVIRIIRYEDEPKQELMKAFGLSDTQADAILNMRLRALRKLEEMEIRKERDALLEEQAGLEALVGSKARQWTRIGKDIKALRKTYGPDTDLGRRRTTFAEAPSIDLGDIDAAMVEREPITVVLSQKGWVRALKGHNADLSRLDFKQGDRLKLTLEAMTTDKLVAVSTGGKVFTLAADKLPGGRGHGDPLRIMVDLEAGQDVVALFVHDPKRKLLMVNTDGYGFVAPEKDIVANTRKGKQVMNLSEPTELQMSVPVEGDMVAVIGQNRKLLLFPLSQIAEMGRGKGVRLQRYKDGGVSDLVTFKTDEGITWSDSAGRQYNRSLEEMAEWRGERAQAGRMAPQGFPRNNKFGA
ncbi:DNA topoisomerase IV subunit A [Ahrensia marina]|uniref:DNA topoisomerase IV subunit A n=1 Tax=Ahrensia marina TaxID=1514904 RepID=UPI0035CF20A2